MFCTDSKNIIFYVEGNKNIECPWLYMCKLDIWCSSLVIIKSIFKWVSRSENSCAHNLANWARKNCISNVFWLFWFLKLVFKKIKKIKEVPSITSCSWGFHNLFFHTNHSNMFTIARITHARERCMIGFI